MNNKTLYFSRSQGLLLVAILGTFFSACSPISSNFPLPSPPAVAAADSSFPNPMQYFLFGNGTSSNVSPDSLSLQELNQLKNGDILLRKGYGTISDYIADFLQEQYPVTHCAFILKKQGSPLQVLHTISDAQHNGLLIEPLEAYLKQSQQGSLVAVRLNYSDQQVQEVLEQAHSLLQEQIPFDMAFDDRDQEALYCIEMMRDIFIKVFQKDLLPQRTCRHTIDVLSMDNFFDNKHFELIFNHFEGASPHKL